MNTKSIWVPEKYGTRLERAVKGCKLNERDSILSVKYANEQQMLYSNKNNLVA